MDIYEFIDVIRYIKHLEDTLKQHVNVDDEMLNHIREAYLKSDVKEECRK